MKKVEICLSFKGGSGYAYITIVPSRNYNTYRQDFDGCHTFYLPPDVYVIEFDGIAPVNDQFATTLVAVLSVDGAVQATKNIAPGQFQDSFQLIL